VIICDTGPIFAAADRKDADHHACVELFTGLRLAGRHLLLPQTVLAEVGYMLEAKVGTFAEVAFSSRSTTAASIWLLSPNLTSPESPSWSLGTTTFRSEQRTRPRSRSPSASG
jgi:predicted nucleic acid-binding protein